MNQYTGGQWMARTQAADPVLQAQIRRRETCEKAINLARLEVRLWPYGVGLAGQTMRGRPPAMHPLPRHNSWGIGSFTAASHKQDHRKEFYPGCRRCKQRERLYFLAHPERRPPGMQTEGVDPWGQVVVRKWVTPGWPEKLEAQEAAKRQLKEMQDYMEMAARGELGKGKKAETGMDSAPGLAQYSSEYFVQLLRESEARIAARKAKGEVDF